MVMSAELSKPVERKGAMSVVLVSSLDIEVTSFHNWVLNETISKQDMVIKINTLKISIKK